MRWAAAAVGTKLPPVEPDATATGRPRLRPIKRGICCDVYVPCSRLHIRRARGGGAVRVGSRSAGRYALVFFLLKNETLI